MLSGEFVVEFEFFSELKCPFLERVMMEAGVGIDRVESLQSI